ncbi:MAG: hypothetical protein ABR878_04370 [Roseiarcus sp.]|jgi:hypothetical protein
MSTAPVLPLIFDNVAPIKRSDDGGSGGHYMANLGMLKATGIRAAPDFPHLDRRPGIL